MPLWHAGLVVAAFGVGGLVYSALARRLVAGLGEVRLSRIAGGLLGVWLWGAEMTTAVTVGFIVLLGVMFNDGILIGVYLFIMPISVLWQNYITFGLLQGYLRQHISPLWTAVTLAVAFTAGQQFVLNQPLFVAERTTPALLCVLAGSAVSLALGFWLIPSYGALGNAWSQLGGAGATFALQAIVVGAVLPAFPPRRVVAAVARSPPIQNRRCCGKARASASSAPGWA